MNQPTGIIHGHCAADRKQETQKRLMLLLRDPKVTHIQIAFTDGTHTEHMWVLIRHINFKSRIVKGRLESEPKFLTNVKCKDAVKCPFKEIEQVY